MTFDKSKFIEHFKTETREHIQKLSQGLLKLEKNPDDKGFLESLMREAHTIKGSASMMGYRRISEIAHGMESGLQRALEEKIRMGKAHFDVLFKCLDAIEPLLEDKLTWEEKGVARPYVEELCARTGEVFKTSASADGEAGRQDRGAHAREEKREEGKAEGIVPGGKEGKFEEDGLRETLHASRTATVSEESIRVETVKLDRLVNLSGELLIAKTRLDETVRNLVSRIDSDIRGNENLGALAKELKEVNEEINSLTSNVQNEVLTVRMVSVSYLFNLFPRSMRDLAQGKGKDVEMQIRGEETQLDKAIIDELKDPLMHILRNAVDHGIETPSERQGRGKPKSGRILMNAYQQGTQVVIEVSDDGRGIDLGAVRARAVKKGIVTQQRAEELVDEQIYQLLFIPGFSTREEVTETSGRGVGLDVVREKVAQLKGVIEVFSKPGEGTRFVMKMPLTLAITECLVVNAGSEMFALPIDAVAETIRVDPDEIRTVETKEAITVRGHIMPLVRLKDLFALPEKGIIEKHFFPVVIVQSVERKIGLLVDRVVGRKELVRKNLGEPLRNIQNIAGATILGDGSVILILDIASIIQSAEGVVIRRQAAQARPAAVKKKRKTILLAEDSLSTAMLEKNVLEAAGFSVVIARDGKEALEKASQEKFDLVISDILMPRMDGFELTTRLKQDEFYRNVPVIIVTTRESDADKKRGLEAGAE
ncbi:MAG TPA: chemotaxis protein CheW, partial [Candidatus Omnitrophota bacterium]|nr:chemotaxis protein CheW [Candidatus Omnitrophota bacterium]